MKDRELLELAAFAAKFDKLTRYSEAIQDHDSPHCNYPALYEDGPGGEWRSWNPLVDDGDALRLAVNLNMLCDFGSYGCLVEAKEGNGPCTEVGDYRRAIVRAAAEIGKKMKEKGYE